MEVSRPYDLHHRMQSEHVPVGIDGQRDEAVLADRELGFEDAAAGAKGASCLDRAVVAVEVHERAVAAGLDAGHVDQSAGAAHAAVDAREGPHLEAWVFAAEALEAHAEHGFVEVARARDVIDVDFKPANRVLVHGSPFGMSGRMTSGPTAHAAG